MGINVLSRNPVDSEHMFVNDYTMIEEISGINEIFNLSLNIYFEPLVFLCCESCLLDSLMICKVSGVFNKNAIGGFSRE